MLLSDDAGIEIELIEKRAVLGGKTSSWQDDAGDHIESGLHCYFRCYKELLQFFQHVGVYQHIRWKEHSFLIARPDGKHARLTFTGCGRSWTGSTGGVAGRW